MDRIGTLSFHQGHLTRMQNVMVDIATIQQQISSGKKDTTYDTMEARGDVEYILGLDERMTRLSALTQSNQVTTTEIQTMSQSISDLQNIAQSFAQALVSRRTASNAGTTPLTQIAQSNLTQISERLNVSLRGRYLFSGSRTDTPPVQNIDVSNLHFPQGVTETNPLYAVPTASYYAGDATKRVVQIAPGEQLQYGINADNPAFQTLISAMHMAIAGHQDNNDAILAKAVDLINTAIGDLANVRASLEYNIGTIETTKHQYDHIVAYYATLRSNVADTDILSSTRAFSEQQAVLQASFTSFAKISQLSLSDYL